MNATGMLQLTEQLIETGDGHFYRHITDAKLVEGPPIVLVSDRTLNILPDYAIAMDGELVQLGELVLRRTIVRDVAACAEYYYIVDGGLAHWLYWRINEALELVWARVILTLAVWRLAEWPREGAVPSWGDVARRWRR